MNPEPSKEHQWLQQLVGEWTFESIAQGAPDDPPFLTSGTTSFRTLGDVWVVGNMVEQQEHGPHYNIISLGYDPAKDRFVGTFISSMMPQLWVYEGELDAAANRLVLNSDGPSMDGSGGVAHFQDIVEIPGPNTYIMRSQAEGPDGWVEFMKMTFTRTA